MRSGYISEEAKARYNATACENRKNLTDSYVASRLHKPIAQCSQKELEIQRQLMLARRGTKQYVNELMSAGHARKTTYGFIDREKLSDSYCAVLLQKPVHTCSAAELSTKRASVLKHRARQVYLEMIAPAVRAEEIREKVNSPWSKEKRNANAKSASIRLTNAAVARLLGKKTYDCTPTELQTKRIQVLNHRAHRKELSIMTAEERRKRKIKQDSMHRLNNPLYNERMRQRAQTPSGKAKQSIAHKAHYERLRAAGKLKEHIAKGHKHKKERRQSDPEYDQLNKTRDNERSKRRYAKYAHDWSSASHSVIANRMGLHAKDCPPELVAIKRAQLKVISKLKELNEKRI